MAVSRLIGEIATWISGGETRRTAGSYGCTSITETSPIRSERERYDRLTMRLPARPNLAVQPLMESWWGLKQPSIGHQPHNIPHPVKYRGTVRAHFQMRFHSLT